jgi:class 3 adenylate cyclase
VKEQFGIQYYSLLIADSEKKFLKVHSCFLPRIEDENVRKKVFDFSIPIRGSRGSHAVAIRRKKPLFITEVSAELKSWMRDFDLWIINTFQVNSFLYLPLLLNKEVVGMIDFTNSDEKMNLNDDDLVRLSILGEQMAGILYSSALYKEVEISHNIAEEERKKNEKLLLNILPADIAKELKEKGATEPILYENVSVMFTDFKGFTQIAEILSPQELIRDLDACFVQFDRITERFRLEKLKTIGDSYMCAGGIPKQNKTHALDAVLAAIEIQSFMKVMREIKSEQGLSFWELRLGIHTGPLVAGVIGEKKFAYDVWGDTVNSASRMESSGTPGMINISGSTFALVKDVFDCEYRGKINAKNKGEVEMYYVKGLNVEFASQSDHRIPNKNFWKYYSELERTNF